MTVVINGKRENLYCGNCISFLDCVKESGEIANIENTLEEIKKCMTITACDKYIEDDRTNDA